MQLNLSHAFGILLTILNVGLAGCGGASGKDSLPPVVPVSGAITLDGQPLTDAIVRFIPVDIPQGTDCFGKTNQDGKYEIMQTEQITGAPQGSYKVVISKLTGFGGKPIETGPDAPPPIDQGATESLSPQYSNLNTTRLSADVPAGGGEFNFELKSK